MKARRRRFIRWAALPIVLAATLAGMPAAGAVSQGIWQSLAPALSTRTEASYVQLDGKFYLIGGTLKRLDVYDPITDSWSSAKPMPVKLNHVQAVTVGGKIYVIGGLVSWPSPEVATVYIYDPVSDTWSQGTPMPRGRGAGGTAVYQGKIYYAGGLNGGIAVPWFDEYDPATDTWTPLPDMPRVREHFHAAVVNGYLWAVGGRDVSINNFVTPTDAYDFADGLWEPGFAPIPTPRGGFGTAVSGDEM
ncbi:MAG: Kelch repeat-containing protein, partial [Actinomycetota bacterium]